MRYRRPNLPATAIPGLSPQVWVLIGQSNMAVACMDEITRLKGSSALVVRCQEGGRILGYWITGDGVTDYGFNTKFQTDIYNGAPGAVAAPASGGTLWTILQSLGYAPGRFKLRVAFFQGEHNTFGHDPAPPIEAHTLWPAKLAFLMDELRTVFGCNDAVRFKACICSIHDPTATGQTLTNYNTLNAAIDSYVADPDNFAVKLDTSGYDRGGDVHIDNYIPVAAAIVAALN